MEGGGGECEKTGERMCFGTQVLRERTSPESRSSRDE